MEPLEVNLFVIHMKLTDIQFHFSTKFYLFKISEK